MAVMILLALVYLLLHGRSLSNRIDNFPLYANAVRGGSGLEIGGPSKIFQDNGALPLYSEIWALDNVDISEETIFDNKIEKDGKFMINLNKSYREQFFCDATDMRGFKSGSYDFIMMSHVFEHIANPIKALLQWLRLIKDNGRLILVIPGKNFAFDHKRPISDFSHIVSDYEKNIGEEDETHFEEVLKLHDIDKDPAEYSYDKFKMNTINNVKYRTVHHHVFNKGLIIKIFDHLGVQILSLDSSKRGHIIFLGKKLGAGVLPDNKVFLDKLKEGRSS